MVVGLGGGVDVGLLPDTPWNLKQLWVIYILKKTCPSCMSKENIKYLWVLNMTFINRLFCD